MSNSACIVNMCVCVCVCFSPVLCATCELQACIPELWSCGRLPHMTWNWIWMEQRPQYCWMDSTHMTSHTEGLVSITEQTAPACFQHGWTWTHTHLVVCSFFSSAYELSHRGEHLCWYEPTWQMCEGTWAVPRLQHPVHLVQEVVSYKQRKLFWSYLGSDWYLPGALQHWRWVKTRHLIEVCVWAGGGRDMYPSWTVIWCTYVETSDTDFLLLSISVT